MSRAAPAPEALEQGILASPDDLEARYRLGRHDLCMMTTTVLWRSGLLALFSLLGEQDVRTQRYRAELLNYRVLKDIFRDRVRPGR